MGAVTYNYRVKLSSVHGTIPTEKFMNCFNGTVDVIYQKNYIPPKPLTIANLIFAVVATFAIAGVTFGCVYLNQPNEEKRNRDVELGVINNNVRAAAPPANPVVVGVDGAANAEQMPLVEVDQKEGEQSFQKRYKSLIEKIDALLLGVGEKSLSAKDMALKKLKEELIKFEEKYKCGICLELPNVPITISSGQTYDKQAFLNHRANLNNPTRNKCPNTRGALNNFDGQQACNVKTKNDINDGLAEFEKRLKNICGDDAKLAAAVDNIALVLAANNAAAGDSGVVEGAVAVTIQPPPSSLRL